MKVFSYLSSIKNDIENRGSGCIYLANPDLTYKTENCDFETALNQFSETVEHKIISRGISFAGKTYFWDQLTRFWTTQRFGSELLVVETIRLPGRLEFVINAEDKDKLRQLLSLKLPYEEASPTFLDKAASWLSKRVPLEA